MTERADMAHQWGDGVIRAPSGFLILARTGEDLRAVHCDSGKIARVSGVTINVDGSADAVQRELIYACVKLLRELERA